MGRIGLIGIFQEPILLSSAEETFILGRNLAALLGPNSILALYGDLGAGKTTFVQGLAEGLNITDPIQSPTFVTLNLYQGTLPLFHFDLYRLKNEADFFQLGFDEYFQKEGICAIEWPDLIAPRLPPETISVYFQYQNAKQRTALIKGYSSLPSHSGVPC